MKNLRNRNQPPNADLVQVYLQSSWDIVKAVYDDLPNIQRVSDAILAGTLDDFLADTDINSLAKLNAIVLDATLGTASDFATAAQGALADSAIQGPLASQGEAEGGVENTKAMTALRVAQAIAVLAAGLQNKLDGTVPPGANDDNTVGYSVGSFWIDIVASPNESYRCVDSTTAAAVWIKTTLTADELATVAISGDSDDLIQGVVQLLMTVTERSKLAAIEANATADQTGAEIKTAYELEANTNAFTDAEQTKLTGIETAATADQTNSEIESGYNAQVNQVSAGEKTAGTEVAVRRFAPKDVADMAGTHGGGGGGGLTVEHKSASFTAVAGKKYFVDSSGGAVVVTLPAGIDLDNIIIADSGHSAATFNITVNPDGTETINGDTTFIIDQNEGDIDIGYNSTGTDWKVSADGTTDLVNANDFVYRYRGVNNQVGTTYGFVRNDEGKLVTCNNAGAITATIPANSAVPYEIGTRIDVLQLGAGQVTIALTTDTLRGNTKINAQYECISLVKIATTEWVIIGGVV